MQFGFTTDKKFDEIFPKILKLNSKIREVSGGQNISFGNCSEIDLKNLEKKELGESNFERTEVYQSLTKYIPKTENYLTILKKIEINYPRRIWGEKLPSAHLIKKLINEDVEFFY